ncbi:PREDICTED: C-type lectin domain family 10 member A-like [Poecilia mexicana]|uniref:C-type lectin domain family 10 member A-like n=1 Tax=Poecilia mexicana TaxID=48701 RepID=UPI00072E0EB2|nr:PREDICTED: C-type lectin domain family 10 member A-like [Poecilia mexicana]
MEKKHMHVQHSRLSNSASLRSCRGSESRFHLSVILFFGVFSICLLIGLLVTNAQYNDAKRRLTEDLQALTKTHESTISERDSLKIKLDEKSKEQSMSAQNIDSKCNSKDELQSDLTDRLLACNESLFNITKERDELKVRLIESLKEGIDEGLSLQNNSMDNMTETTDLSAVSDNLTASFQENTTCPLGWPKFNCSCYQIFGKGSWDEGRENCTREGGDLVVINNPEEQNFLAELGVDGWIGLRETEGSWLWVDGTAPNFTSWSINQTDNGGGDEDCAHITFDAGSAWNDLPCNATKRWICEKKYQQCLLHNF